MSSLDRFAYAVKSIEDLAPAVGAALAAQLLPGEIIQQMVFAPGHAIQPVRNPADNDLFGMPPPRGQWPTARSGQRQNPDWVLVLTVSRLLVVTIWPASSTPQVTAAPLVHLVWLELGTILLYSWIEWSWVSEGKLEQERVYFNTVSEELFWQVVNTVRRRINSQMELPPPITHRHLGILTAMPFKFQNITYSKVFLPEDDVRAAVYQPPIWRRRFVVLRQARAPGMIVVLSTTHLLVAYEDLSYSRASYGMVARYCPYDRLRGAVLERTQDDLWLKVMVGLGETEVTLRILFEPALETTLQVLVDRLNASLSPPAPVLEGHGQVYA
jgi:hypothetical protein